MHGRTRLGAFLLPVFTLCLCLSSTHAIGQTVHYPMGSGEPPVYQSSPYWMQSSPAVQPLFSPQGTAVEEGLLIDVAPLWMQRNLSEKVSVGEFVELTTGTFAGRQTTRNLRYDMDLGLQVDASWGIGSESRLQLLFAGVDAWGEGDYHPVPVGTLGYSSYFATATRELGADPGVGFGGVTDGFDVANQSRYYNFEINLQRKIGHDDAHWLAGFRYIHLGDDLTIAADSQTYGLIEFTETAGRNNIFGLQLGASYPIYFKYLTVTLFGKVGGFGNVAEGRSSNSGVGGLFRENSQSDYNFVVTSMLDFGLKARLKLTQWLSLNGSYQIIGIRGVALAPDQLSNVNVGAAAAPALGIPLGQIPLMDTAHTDSSIWMQAVTATVELNW